MSKVCLTNVDRYVHVHIAAREVGYSVRMLRNLIEKGELRAKRIGKRAWKILLSDLYLCLYRRMQCGQLRKRKARAKLFAVLERESLNADVRTNNSAAHISGSWAARTKQEFVQEKLKHCEW